MNKFFQDLFSAFIVTSVRETTLGGNQWLEENNRLKWNTEENDIFKTNYSSVPLYSENEDAISVELKPMQIRTFIVKLSPRK